MAKTKRRTKAERDSVAKMKLRELLYAMLLAANGGHSIQDDLLDDIPQCVGTEGWIGWLWALQAKWPMWIISGPSDAPFQQTYFGKFFSFHELKPFASFEETVNRLFEKGARA